jgi:hypothetical protein
MFSGGNEFRRGTENRTLLIQNGIMNRRYFINRLTRIVMSLLLAALAVVLGLRASTSAGNCSGCPGKGVCRGPGDCETWSRAKSITDRK